MLVTATIVDVLRSEFVKELICRDTGVAARKSRLIPNRYEKERLLRFDKLRPGKLHATLSCDHSYPHPFLR